MDEDLEKLAEMLNRKAKEWKFEFNVIADLKFNRGNLVNEKQIDNIRTAIITAAVDNGLHIRDGNWCKPVKEN